MVGIQCGSSRYDWYQSDGKVTLTVLKRGVTIDECSAQLDGMKHLVVKVKDEIAFEADLHDLVDGKRMTVTCTPSKIEIVMPKLSGEMWPSLEAQLCPQKPESCTAGAPKKNWEKLGREVEKEEEDEGGVDKFFQKLYKDADEDVRKAMLKSYTESCGTVLSTNWQEIGKKKTDVKPPDSMEHKKY